MTDAPAHGRTDAPAHGRTDARTVGELLKLVRDQIGDEADDLYAAIVGGNRSSAFLDREKAVPDAVSAKLLLAAARRSLGWPQQYATGRANFRGHWLSVDQRVLIPRPETEGLVELVLKEIGRTGGRADGLPLVADIGTGSGAIAIALALEGRVQGVIATDLSAEALNVALENALSLGAKERISFRRGDGCLPLLDDTVDVLVSNPPYIATREWEQLEASVKAYEPRLALDGGGDGLDLYRRLVTEAVTYLNPGGLLALEVDERRADATAMLATQAGFDDVSVHSDLSGRPRYVLGRRPEQS